MSHRTRRKRKEGGNLKSIRARDRTKCHLCGQGVSAIEASRDHLHPRSSGGYDKSRNYKLAHRDCNTARGAMPMDVARAAIEEHRISGGRMTRPVIVTVLRRAHGRWVKADKETSPLRADPK